MGDNKVSTDPLISVAKYDLVGFLGEGTCC